MSDSRLSVRALLLLFLLAAGLRLLPAGYGLPHGFYYDEHRYLSKAVRIGVEGLRPERYDYGPLFPYALAGGLGVVYGVGYGTKSWSSLTEFQDLYFRDPSLFLLTGRVLSALAGTVAVILLVAGARHWLRKPQRPGPGELDVLLGPMGPGVRLGPWLAGAGLAVFSAAVAFGAQGKAEALALLLITFWLYCAGRYHRGSHRGCAPPSYCEHRADLRGRCRHRRFHGCQRSPGWKLLRRRLTLRPWIPFALCLPHEPA